MLTPPIPRFRNRSFPPMTTWLSADSSSKDTNMKANSAAVRSVACWRPKPKSFRIESSPSADVLCSGWFRPVFAGQDASRPGTSPWRGVHLTFHPMISRFSGLLRKNFIVIEAPVYCNKESLPSRGRNLKPWRPLRPRICPQTKGRATCRSAPSNDMVQIALSPAGLSESGRLSRTRAAITCLPIW